MEDFFDNFDWEDMAMIGGMAEEFAEERRDRRRREGEEYFDPEDEFDFDNGFRRRPTGFNYSRKRPRRKPFEQYAYEVAHGLKHHHDPLYGPANRRRGAGRRPKNFTDTILYGVLAKNAHLVSENFLKFACTIFYGYPDQEIDSIIFDPDGNPVFDGHEVFSTFDRGSRTITMNLRRHFANAVRVAEHGYTGFSMQALIWNGMVETVLHELKHALDACEAGYMGHVPREEQERMADQWASEAKTYFARQGNSEMPELGAEPYFGPLVTQFLQQVTKKNHPQWAIEQQEMTNAGIYYHNKDAGIEVYSMQDFYEHSYQGLNGNDYGQRLNACLQTAYELEEQIWKQEELNEMAIKEAVSADRRVQINHVDAVGNRHSQILFPRSISTKNYYLWMEATVKESCEIISIRVDRIIEVVFLD